jgi:hypothetical protein
MRDSPPHRTWPSAVGWSAAGPSPHRLVLMRPARVDKAGSILEDARGLYGGGLMGVLETLMAHGRKLALLLAGCALGGCTPTPAPQPPANGLVIEVSPRGSGPAPVSAAAEPAIFYEDGLAGSPRHLDPDYRLASLDDPNDPVWPGALNVLLKAQAGGLPIYTMILSSPNLSPRDVERAAATGKLSNFGKHPGSSFLGAVGEAIVMQYLLTHSAPKGTSPWSPNPRSPRSQPGSPRFQI